MNIHTHPHTGHHRIPSAQTIKKDLETGCSVCAGKGDRKYNLQEHKYCFLTVPKLTAEGFGRDGRGQRERESQWVSTVRRKLKHL